MCERRVQRGETVTTSCFRSDRNDSHERSNETVLEYSKVNDLASYQQAYDKTKPILLTLNQVKPLLGVLQKLGQHLAAQLSGNTQDLGFRPRT